MTEVKTRAIELINRLPDDKMTYVLGILQVFEEIGVLETGANHPIKTGDPRGYQRLLKYRGTLNRHVDIKKEYAESLDEKYAIGNMRTYEYCRLRQGTNYSSPHQ